MNGLDQELLLTARHLSDIQSSVLAVGSGATQVATLSVDYLGSRGVGQLVIAAVDGALWARVCAPAIEKHLAGRA